MRSTKGMVQLRQRLPPSVPSEDQAFYSRAVQAQRVQRTRDREAVIRVVQDRAKREHDELKAWQEDERRWKREFEQWWERMKERANKGNQTRRLHAYRTIERFGYSVNTLTFDEWKEIQARYHYKCAYCQQRKPLTKDHIVPISKGGFHTKLNVIPACHSCNSKKGARPAHLYKPTLIPF